jgi:1,4-dihydroxy-2-naphthoate octaprenyltransferase
MPHPKYWLAAFRLRTLPLALSTIFTGSYAAAVSGAFRCDVLLLASLTTLFLQILSNLANDYGDGVAGTDQHRQGEKRMVQSGLITQSHMLQMIIVFALLSLVSGIGLLMIALPQLFSFRGLSFLILGVLGIGAAINYTIGRNPYGYKGWGDFFVFVFFGLVGVFGSFYLHAGIFQWDVMLLAIALGLFSAGVLNVNNMRDEVSDRAAGKRSLVVIHGHRFGVIYHFCLMISAWILVILYVEIHQSSFVNWLFLITGYLFVRHLRVVWQTTTLQMLDPQLKQLSLAIFFLVILLIVGYIAPLVF